MNSLDIGRIRVLGVPVDCLDMERTLAWVDEAVSTPGHKRVMAVNPEKVMAARRDPGLLRFLEESDLLIPDGIGVVKAARILGIARMERVAGSDLMPAICARAPERGYRIFIYGARPEVNDASVAILRKRHPGIDIVGSSHGYVPEEGMDDLVRKINESGAHILFVALGSPRQEKWLDRYGPALETVRVSQGIGGTLDTIAGTVKRAPAVFRGLNLEWFYRLASDPRRARRQTALPAFLFQVLKARLGGAGGICRGAG